MALVQLTLDILRDSSTQPAWFFGQQNSQLLAPDGSIQIQGK